MMYGACQEEWLARGIRFKQQRKLRKAQEKWREAIKEGWDTTEQEGLYDEANADVQEVWSGGVGHRCILAGHRFVPAYFAHAWLWTAGCPLRSGTWDSTGTLQQWHLGQ